MSCERTRIASGSLTWLPTSYLPAGKRLSPTCAMLLSVRMRNVCAMMSAVLYLKFAHEFDQCLDARERHRIVNRRAHAADRTVTLELSQPARLCLLEEYLVERFVSQPEWHIHQRAVAPRHRRVVELGLIKEIVKNRRLGAVNLFHLLQAAQPLQPLEHESRDIN